MAHFAKINENNIVEQVVVVNNSILLDENGIEKESKGVDFLNSLFGSATWIQTSYNNNFRKQYAGLNYTYDKINDVFVCPQPYNSWSLDSNFDWQPPTPYPDDGLIYIWNEENKTWDSD